VRHVLFPGEDGAEDRTRPTVFNQCAICADETGEWVRSHYGVDAHIGDTVTYAGHPARVFGFASGTLNLLTGPRGRWLNYVNPRDERIHYQEATP